jgi:hypothetical protein
VSSFKKVVLLWQARAIEHTHRWDEKKKVPRASLAACENGWMEWKRNFFRSQHSQHPSDTPQHNFREYTIEDILIMYKKGLDDRYIVKTPRHIVSMTGATIFSLPTMLERSTRATSLLRLEWQVELEEAKSLAVGDLLAQFCLPFCLADEERKKRSTWAWTNI